MKCTLKPLRDERAREMFAHTAAKRRIANVAAGSVTLHPKKKGEPLFVKIKSLIKALKIDIFDAVTSKMRRAHFPNECDLSHE